MSDVFISYVEEDGDIIQKIAAGLDQAGFSAWYYQRDSIPGLKHFNQTREVINNCQAILLIVSKHTIHSSWVGKEVEWGDGRRKPIIPVLLEISYDEFMEQQGTWGYLIGSGTVALYLTQDNLQQILPRLIAGLHGLGVTPQETGLIARIADRYPYPLANAYAGKLAHVSGPEQAFQLHQGLGDLAITFIKYLASITIAWYRQKSQHIGGEALDVENRLADLHSPNLENWIGLLYTCLNLPEVKTDELIQAIYKYLYDQRHRKDPICDSVNQIYSWLQKSHKVRPSVTNEDFFEALVAYSGHQQGWASQGAVLSAAIYQERAELLQAGLEAALLEAEFLSDYPLIYIQPEQIGTDRVGANNVYHATGRNLAVKDEKISPVCTIEAGHVGLFERTVDGFRGRLDLNPLLICQTCNRCNQLSMFFLESRGDLEPRWISHTCNHRQELTSNQAVELNTFISLEKWRLRHPPAALRPLVNTLRQVYADGLVTPEERNNLDFLIDAMGIQPEQARRLESLIKEEMKVEVAEPPESAHPTPLPVVEPPDENLPGSEKSEPDGSETVVPKPVAPPSESRPGKYVLSWRKPLGDPCVEVGIFGDPPQVFAAAESGEVVQFDLEGKLIYQDQFPSRLFRLNMGQDEVFAGCWDGHVYRIGPEGLAWQIDLQSPISALDSQPRSGLVVAGTWAGQVVGIDLTSGAIRWQSELQDGISALAMQPGGTRIACGTYGGHLAILEAGGEKVWLRDMQAGISQIRFLGQSDEIIVASQDANLISLNVGNQQVVWEQGLPGFPNQAELSANRRHLFIVSTEMGLTLYNLDGKPSIWKEYTQAGLDKLVLLPYSPEGNTLLAVSGAQGIYVVDNLASTVNLEIETPANCTALSSAGRFLVVGDQERISLYRIGRPILEIKLTCQEELKLGRYTRLEIQLKNSGEIEATNISLSLEGAFDCQGIKTPSRLPAGKSTTSTNQSLRPEAEGALPVRVHIKYADQLGFQHEHEDIQVLDVSSSV